MVLKVVILVCTYSHNQEVGVNFRAEVVKKFGKQKLLHIFSKLGSQRAGVALL